MTLFSQSVRRIDAISHESRFGKRIEILNVRKTVLLYVENDHSKDVIHLEVIAKLQRLRL